MRSTHSCVVDVYLTLVCAALLGASPTMAQGASSGSLDEIVVSALGRIQPKDGLRAIHGPAEVIMVVEELHVDEGDHVEKGQLIALLEGARSREAEVETAASAIRELEAAVEQVSTELRHSEAELTRFETLRQTEVVSESLRDSWRFRAESARAQIRVAEAAVATGRSRLALAEARLERTRVFAPISAQVIEVHAREGERVGLTGILDLGVTSDMYAVAEVYETDIGRVAPGQRARIASAALPQPLFGTVERIALKVGKVDVLGTDPAARTDARVVEVEIRLENGDLVRSLTNLEVEVAFLKASSASR